ncbi:sperm flagellar protein 1-like [Chironomus tepperi]|uniref:sperm flagellar protein 1-like n=1 Tax=Chironomus tepperi TaxID=113505 RepID=UPI00391F577F
MLDAYELQDVLKWVDSFTLSRPSKKLSRDFADAVLLAEILKYEFPKLVELHNYAGCFAIKERMKNWDILNQKVLKKLQINLKREEMEKLAKAESNCIEQLLHNVMNKIKLVKEMQMKELERNESLSNIVTITKQIGDHVEIQQVIPYTNFEELQVKHEELQQEFETQKLHVHDLEEEIKELRNALESKSQIIQDLDARLEESRKKSHLSMSSIRKSLANLF